MGLVCLRANRKNSPPRATHRLMCAICLAWLLVTGMALRAEPPADWPARIRGLVDSGRMSEAVRVAEEWMAAYPQDLDARAWHARLLAWSHRWPEAEAEYRLLLSRSPGDADVLFDLARLLAWQRRYAESREIEQHACAVRHTEPDCDVAEARALKMLGRRREAREKYKALLENGMAVEESRASLDELSASHEVRVGGETDLLSYAGNAASGGVSIDSRWNDRWRSSGGVTRYSRFGETATAFEGSATYRLSGHDSLSVGGGSAGEQGIVPRAQAQFEYGHGFRLAESLLRGIETDYQQRWLWFRGARVLRVGPAATLYFPKNWSWAVRLADNRIDLAGSQRKWKPAAMTRLTFPIRKAVSGNLVFSAGTENLGTADQLRWSATRSVGGGLRIRVASRQELIPLVEYQQLAPGRSQTSLGFAYAFRL